MSTKTTAQYRLEAWDAREAGNYTLAAILFGQAFAAYPATWTHSELMACDRAGLKMLGKECLSMARAVQL